MAKKSYLIDDPKAKADFHYREPDHKAHESKVVALIERTLTQLNSSDPVKGRKAYEHTKGPKDSIKYTFPFPVNGKTHEIHRTFEALVADLKELRDDVVNGEWRKEIVAFFGGDAPAKKARTETPEAKAARIAKAAETRRNKAKAAK